MRFLDAPDRGPISAAVTDGANIFNNIGCTMCHTPSLKTGPSSSPALANKTASLYSDLALHHMGGELTDSINQGVAERDDFRTAPLWGLGKRRTRNRQRRDIPRRKQTQCLPSSTT